MKSRTRIAASASLITRIVVGAVAAAALGACAGGGTPKAPANARATAMLKPTAGNATAGNVTFAQSGNRVVVRGEVTGLPPNAEHGFHVHEKGDCSSPDAESAGGHFNPTTMPHGQHSGGMHHAGDLPSLKSNASGVAAFSFESTTITVGAGVTDVVGKGLIVHKNPDDYKTQPTGNAGARLACAVIAAG